MLKFIYLGRLLKKILHQFCIISSENETLEPRKTMTSKSQDQRTTTSHIATISRNGDNKAKTTRSKDIFWETQSNDIEKSWHRVSAEFLPLQSVVTTSSVNAEKMFGIFPEKHSRRSMLSRDWNETWNHNHQCTLDRFKATMINWLSDLLRAKEVVKHLF